MRKAVSEAPDVYNYIPITFWLPREVNEFLTFINDNPQYKTVVLINFISNHI